MPERYSVPASGAKMKSLLTFVLMVPSLLFTTYGYSGVSLSGTRLIYDATKKEASITVNNSDKIAAVLIQSWVNERDSNKTKAPFVVTPPLFRLEPGQENVLRIIQVGGNLPEDRESLFWLNVKAIPSSSGEQKNTLQVALNNRIKFIYRPEKVTGLPEDSAKVLRWERNGNQIQVTNPTPFYMNFAIVTIGGKPVRPASPEQTYVAPHSILKFPVLQGANGNNVTWKIINDYGGASKTFSAKY